MAYDISSWNKPAGPASNDELDRRAMRRLPDWAKDVVREVCHRHDVPIREIFGPGQDKGRCDRRHEAIYRVKFAKPSVSSGQLGHWFDRDHSIDHARARPLSRSSPAHRSCRCGGLQTRPGAQHEGHTRRRPQNAATVEADAALAWAFAERDGR